MKGSKNPNYKFGQTTAHRKEYNSWRAMKERCDNPKYRAFERYGGRGISYCERWKDFGNFLQDMGKRPDGCTLDRIDNDKDYCPKNCRWATQTEQMRNSTKVSKAKVTKDMLEKAKCSMATVYKRLKLGWTLEKALNTPPENPRDVLRKKRLENHNRCPVCGKICPHKRDRYCCKEHFWLTRRENGTFSKEVNKYAKEEESKRTTARDQKPSY